MVNAAERMLRTAGHLMVVAEGSKATTLSTFDAREVVSSVVASYQEMGVMIDAKIEGCESFLLDASPVQFEALLCSLLGNATDHGEDGNVTLRAYLTESRCEIRIENEICRATKHRGLGLGTYIGNKLASEMSASIFTDRTEDTFVVTVSVPLAKSLPIAV